MRKVLPRTGVAIVVMSMGRNAVLREEKRVTFVEVWDILLLSVKQRTRVEGLSQDLARSGKNAQDHGRRRVLAMILTGFRSNTRIREAWQYRRVSGLFLGTLLLQGPVHRGFSYRCVNCKYKNLALS